MNTEINITLPTHTRPKYLEISPAIVDAETNEDTLAGWYEHLDDSALECTEFAKAMLLVQLNDDRYFKSIGGKIAHCNVAKKLVENRMIYLGFEVPYLPTDPREAEIAALEAEVERLKKASA